MVVYAGSPTRTVYVGVTLIPSKVKVNLSGLLNFRQLAKPCMLAAMTAAPLRGFLVLFYVCKVTLKLSVRVSTVCITSVCCRLALLGTGVFLLNKS